MLKALAWKEWREQRPLVVTAMAIAALLPLFFIAGLAATSSSYQFEYLIALMRPILVGFVWPAFGAAIAGTTFAADIADGSLPFLLSRPVSRARVWLVKVGMAAVAFVAVVIGTTLIEIFYIWLDAANGVQFGLHVRQLIGPLFDPGALGAAVFLLLLFGCCIYCSMFVRRPIVAAGGGFLVAAGLLGAVGAIWWIFLHGSANADVFYGLGMVTGIPLATVSVFVAGFWVFWTGDIIAGKTWQRALRPLFAIVLLVAVVGAGPAYYGSLRIMARRAVVLRGSLAVDAGAVVLADLTPAGLSTRITRVPLDGGASSVLVAEHATMPVISPDGEWVVYVDYRGDAGAQPGDAALRAVRKDGSDDRLLVETLRGRVGRSTIRTIISPDSDRVAVTDFRFVQIASLTGSSQAELDMRVSPEPGARFRSVGPIGWRGPASSELLWYRSFRRRTEVEAGAAGTATRRAPVYLTQLLAFDAITGESRLVHEFNGRDNYWRNLYGRHAALPIAWLPAWIDDGEAERLYLVETGSGELVEVTESPCRLWGLSADGARLLYATCSGEQRYGNARIEMRYYDFATGADELFTVLENYNVGSGSRGLEALPSPDGERVLIYASASYGSEPATYIVSRVGNIEHLAAGTAPLAWIDDRRALLTRTGFRRPFELSVVDLDTRTVRRIYPR